MSRKKLPLGIQDFEKLRTGNFIYVDKTEFIYELIDIPLAYYFLSRPRRFGKSLLVSTLASLFEGKRDLFDGLWIAENTGYSWEPHPVITIDFNEISHQKPEFLDQGIRKRLARIAEQNGLSFDITLTPEAFTDLITELSKKYNKAVVVLIDEYDKAIISHLGKGEEELNIAVKNMSVLKQLFGVLKGQSVSGILRFVFLTGVSKFSQVSIFSDLNNLNDLTMQKPFSTMLGYTEEELYHYFKEYMTELAEELSLSEEECKARLREWYNGYRFTSKDIAVYNPYSILSVLKNLEFENYWFETGTPSFLVNLLEERNYSLPLMEQLEIRKNAFTKYEIEDISMEALLYQTGYITIKEQKGALYHLSYPNQEVKNSFTDYLYQKIVRTKNVNIKNKFTCLADYLKDCNLEKFIETVNIILSSVTYHQIAGQDESFYHTVFYLMLSASGVEVLTEVLSSQGRLDIAVFFPDRIYIIELKCNKSGDEALAQIKEKKYAHAYKAGGKEIVLVGINFDTKKRAVTDWKYEND